jgi:hypothetical protein
MNAMADPTTLSKGIIVKVMIIAALAKAIDAGVKHRILLRTTPALAVA